MHDIYVHVSAQSELGPLSLLSLIIINFRIEQLVTQSKLQKEFNDKMTEQMSNLERQLIVCSLALEQIAHKIDTIGQFYSCTECHIKINWYSI